MLETRTRRVAALCLGVVLAATAGAATADPEGTIKYRQSVMKAIAGHTGAIAQIIFGKVDHPDQLVGHAHALAELGKYVPSAFKDRVTEGKTNAKPEIWSDWKDFESKAGDLAKGSAALAAATRSGGDVKGAFEEMTDACKACHKKYRKKTN